MKTVKLLISYGSNKAGDFVTLDDQAARHFIAKGWAVEDEEKPKAKKVQK